MEHNGTRMNTHMEWKQARKMVICHCGFQLFALTDEYSNPKNRKEQSD